MLIDMINLILHRQFGFYHECMHFRFELPLNACNLSSQFIIYFSVLQLVVCT